MIHFENQGVHYQLLTSPDGLREKEARNAKLIGPIPRERTFNDSAMRTRRYKRVCKLPDCRARFETTNRIQKFCDAYCQQTFNNRLQKQRKRERRGAS